MRTRIPPTLQANVVYATANSWQLSDRQQSPPPVSTWNAQIHSEQFLSSERVVEVSVFFLGLG